MTRTDYQASYTALYAPWLKPRKNFTPPTPDMLITATALIAKQRKSRGGRSGEVFALACAFTETGMTMKQFNAITGHGPANNVRRLAAEQGYITVNSVKGDAKGSEHTVHRATLTKAGIKLVAAWYKAAGVAADAPVTEPVAVEPVTEPVTEQVVAPAVEPVS